MEEAVRQEPKTAKKGSLMIVDDEISVLKTLEKLLSSHYEIIPAESGEKALELLVNGARPNVILSDQIMPGMTGAEFLDKSFSYSPDSVRVILTGNSTPKDIIMAINQAHAYMFLTKPWDNVQLIQAIRLCFDHNKLQIQNKLLNSKISNLQKESEEKLVAKPYQNISTNGAEDSNSFMAIANALSHLVLACEDWHYTSHTSNVAAIAKEIGREANLAHDIQGTLLISALLHNITSLGMPIRFQLTDPDDLNETERKEFFKFFNARVVALSKIPKFQKIASIISSIWERHDGSGFPLGLSGMQLSKEAQILAMCNIYHNKVYRLTLEEFKKDRVRGHFIQPAETTLERHNEVIKYFYRHSSWFDIDLSNHFHNIIKKKGFQPLIPVVTSLEIRLDAEGSRNYAVAGGLSKSARQDFLENQGDSISSAPHSNDARVVEKEILVEQLQAGMQIGQNVITKAGILIVRQDSILDASHVRNIKSASQNGMLGKSVTILVKSE